MIFRLFFVMVLICFLAPWTVCQKTSGEKTIDIVNST